MEHLNLQHLLYFWSTIREGTMQAAASSLGLTQPTISAQIAELEKAFGKPLFERHGKTLQPTEFGLVVAKYAEEIFSLSNELVGVAEGRFRMKPIRLAVGVVDIISKRSAFELLKPFVEEIRNGEYLLSVTEGSHEKLLTEISSRALDFAFSDSPIAADSRVRISCRKIATNQVWLVASPELASRLRKNFPKSLNKEPLLLPRRNTQLRRELDLWLMDHKVSPAMIGQFDDTALMKEFAKAGLGVMPLANLPAEEAGLEFIGAVKGLTQSLFLLYPERKQQHPALSFLNKIFAI